MGLTWRSYRASPDLPIMKILFFTHNLNYEGAPGILYYLAKEINTMPEYDAVVLSMRDGPARTLLTGYSIETRLVSKAPWSFHEVLLQDKPVCRDYMILLEECIRAISPNLVFVNVLHSFFVVNIVHCMGLPSVWLIHESYPLEDYLDLLPEYQHENLRDAFQRANHVVFCAGALPALYHTCLKSNNFHVIYPAIPPAFSAPYGNKELRTICRNRFNIPENAVMCINVGAIEPHKNQGLILEAAKRLGHIGIRFFLIGGNKDSSYQQSLAETIENSGIQDNVTIVDQVDDVVPFYLAADLFVFTSTWDSYPLVILEAMAFGLPIITTPLAGVREQVQIGFNATETSNDPEELAGHIIELACDTGQRRMMGINSRTVYESLPSHASMVNRYERLFRPFHREIIPNG